MHNKPITTQFWDIAWYSELEQSTGAQRNKTLSPSCQLKLNTSDTLTPQRKFCGFAISGMKSMENQFPIQFYWELTIRARFNDPTTINSTCTWSTSICEALENKLLEIKYVLTNKNIEDIFTEPLSRPLFEKFREMLGLSYTWGGVLRFFWIIFIYFPFISDYWLRSRTILFAISFMVSSSYLKLRHTLVCIRKERVNDQHSLSLYYLVVSCAYFYSLFHLYLPVL